ncbi:MAG: HNH endonuclease [Alphaproteobacteria bacterium]
MIGILDEGVFVSTYKYAVLVALMDLCLETSGRHGEPPTSITTEQLAAKVLEIYWPQARPYPIGEDGVTTVVLRQNQGVQAKILRLIEDYRGPGNKPLYRCRIDDEEGIKDLQREIEWTLIEMPLPKLQRAGRVDEFLFKIGWDDRVRRREFEGPGFDNLVKFKPGAARMLVSLASVLRPLVHRHWTLMVTRLNDLPEGRLDDFLFGRDRAAVANLAEPLLDLQEGRCFYCAEPVRGRARHVDHFVPWSRHPDDGIANLVVADPRCNRSKRDFLADLRHLERWSSRLRESAGDLAAIAADQSWPRDERVTTAVVRSIYGALPSDVLLWSAVDDFVPLEPSRLRPVLDALPP